MNRNFIRAIEKIDIDGLKAFAGLIAEIARDEISNDEVNDNLRTKLSVKDMDDLNVSLWNGISNALFGLASYNTNNASKSYIDRHIKTFRNSPHAPRISPSLMNAYEEQLEESPVEFQSEFLNQQLDIRNIIYNSKLKCVTIQASFDLVGKGDKHKLRKKIYGLLREEGYKYVSSLDAYQKF